METDKAYLADEANSKKDDGCTAVAAVLLEDRLIVANVGDSRAVLSRGGKGELLVPAHRIHSTACTHWQPSCWRKLPPHQPGRTRHSQHCFDPHHGQT